MVNDFRKRADGESFTDFIMEYLEWLSRSEDELERARR